MGVICRVLVLVLAVLWLPAHAVRSNKAAQALLAAANSNAHFSGNFFAEILASERSRGSLSASPLSAQLVLGMLLPGTRAETASEIREVLAMPTQGDHGQLVFQELLKSLKSANNNVTLVRLGNRFYAAQGFQLHRDFVKSTRKIFGVKPEAVNFRTKATRSRINTWVERSTQGKIKDLIPPGVLNKYTVAVLVNALYFKGTWKKPFRKSHSLPFTKEDGSTVRAPIMANVGAYRSAHFADLKASLLDIAYEGDQLCFVVLLPDEDSSLEQLEREVKGRDITDLLNSATMKEMTVSMPKFKIESSFELKVPFTQMGMPSMFSSNADLSGIADPSANVGRLFVSRVAQKTFIEVSEEGTEAAAATFMEIQPRSMILRDEFHVSRPFLFYVLHLTTPQRATTLFSGRYLGPSPAESAPAN